MVDADDIYGACRLPRERHFVRTIGCKVMVKVYISEY